MEKFVVPVQHLQVCGKLMMQLTDSDVGPDIKAQVEELQVSSMPETPRPAFSAFNQLNYVYGAIAANCFLELEALR